MRLHHLSLTNFRNFIRLETDIPAGATLIVGANAQGKTSLLEAIYYCSSGISFHASSDRQLINFLALEEATPVARIVAEVQGRGRLQRIEIRLVLDPLPGDKEPRLRKEILINGLKRRALDLADAFNAVLFLPQDVDVVDGSPSLRRRYLNATLSQADPIYNQALTEYRKVVTQRNALLKQLQENKSAVDQLQFWDEHLCNFAATLMRSRALALEEIERLAAPIHKSLTRDFESLRLEYLPAFGPHQAENGQMNLPLAVDTRLASVSAKDLQSGMCRALQNRRREEIARGVTLIGPHRDDFRLRANGIDLRVYGSRGQNRTAMLALKLAEVAWIEARTGERPVLLLDEILAELDEERRADVLGRLHPDDQALLTTTDLGLFEAAFVRRARVWHIRGGALAPETESRPAPDSG